MSTREVAPRTEESIEQILEVTLHKQHSYRATNLSSLKQSK